MKIATKHGAFAECSKSQEVWIWPQGAPLISQPAIKVLAVVFAMFRGWETL